MPRDKAQELWNQIEPFAGYGFNKSHSVAYAMLAYKTAYLKSHYPVAFMAAMLNSELSSSDTIAKYIAECRTNMGIRILPPDINESAYFFTVSGDAIRFGLGAVKGVGEGALAGVPAAIVNALGELVISVQELPLTPERVWRALRAASARACALP